MLSRAVLNLNPRYLAARFNELDHPSETLLDAWRLGLTVTIQRERKKFPEFAECKLTVTFDGRIMTGLRSMVFGLPRDSNNRADYNPVAEARAATVACHKLLEAATRRYAGHLLVEILTDQNGGES